MLLELSGITSYYGNTPILRNISFGLEQGECLAVLGRNGVGKTTLMRTIMGLTTRMTGSMSIAGADAAKMPTFLRSHAGLGYIPQGRGILGRFTVKENILLGTFARNDKKTSVPQMCLDLFPYLAENLDKRAGLLSGGQQQQLAIARALVTRPGLLLLDEPTEGIQPSIIKDIGRVIGKLAARSDMAIVLVEQYFEFARDLADDFAIMERGEIVLSGSAADMVETDVRRYLTV